MLRDMGYYAGSSWPFYFMCLFALSIAVFALLPGRDLGRLSNLAFYLTPVAIAITLVFPLIPGPYNSILYMISPIFMAPVMVRRIYGIIRTAEPGRQITRYVSGIAGCMLVYAMWIIVVPAIYKQWAVPVPEQELAFIIPALLAVPAWIGVRRKLEAADEPPASKPFRLSKTTLFAVAVVIVLLFWLDLTHAVLHTAIASVGDETSNLLYTLLAYVIPPAAYFVFAVISDKGFERVGIICGMSLFLVCIMIALLPISTRAVLLPLSLADGFGGGYAEFFIWTFPIYFLFVVKRPVFVAALGVIANLVSSAYLWKADVWLPEPLLHPYTPALAIAAIAAVAFVVTVYFLFDRYREKTLAAALYALLHSQIAEARDPVMADGRFTRQEQGIALLLIEGHTRRDICRKLHLTAEEVNSQMDAIRDKVYGAGETDFTVDRIAREFKLTGRETEILQCLCQSMTNPQIAAELFISDETVRIHVRNLLRKLSIENRRDVPVWVEAFGQKSSSK